MAREDLQETIETLNKGWEEFKAEHKKGSAADKEKLARIEADIASADAKNQVAVAAKEAEVKALKGQIDELEKKFNRGGLPGAGDREQAKLEEKERWVTALRYGHPDLTPGAEVKWEEERKRKGLKLEHKALTMSDDTAGGYLSGPADYIREIIKAEVLFSPVRGLVRVRQTSMRNVQIPKRTGTAAATWVGENQTRTEATNPAYALVDCATHEMSAEVYVSFQDLEDSAFDLEAELTQEFAEQFSVTEGLAVVAGNGKEKPWGFTDAGQAVPTTNSGNGTTIQDANGQANGIISLVHAVKSAYAVRGKFVLARATLGSVRKLQDTQKRYIWEPSLVAGAPSSILGYPYVEVPDMPLEGSGTLPIGFGDFQRAYTLVDRLSVAVMRDPYTKASAGQVKFLARRRVGGQVVLAEAIRLLKCA
jgi:HK97 family phage major capsid protein